MKQSRRRLTSVSLEMSYYSTCVVDEAKLLQACDLHDDWGGGRILRDADERIAALVEVGAIPYREKYEGRM